MVDYAAMIDASFYTIIASVVLEAYSVVGKAHRSSA
jgi:hypothetical protein